MKTCAGSYRYGFNGKENDNEVKGEGNQQDYGMRIYDGRIGRFLSVDPLTATYPWLTPYQFASNTPIMAIDLDGLEMTLPRIGTWSLPETYLSLPRIAVPLPPTLPPIAIPIDGTQFMPNTFKFPSIQGNLSPSDIDVSRSDVIRLPKVDIELAYKQRYDPIGALDDPSWTGGYKNKIPPKGGKPKNDIPEWSKGHAPRVGESGKDFAKRLIDEYFGKGSKEGKDTGPGSDFSKIKKYGDTHFKDVIPLSIDNFIKYREKMKDFKNELKKYEKEQKEYYDKHPEEIL